MKTPSRWGFFFALFLVTPLAFGQAPTSTEQVTLPKTYSADMTSNANGLKSVSKVFVDGDKMRMENEINGMKSVTIMRGDWKKMYALMPDQKAYIEMPMAIVQDPVTAAVNGKWEPLGTDVVNGRPCTKHLVTTSINGQPMQVYYWLTDVNQYPLRMATMDGKMVTDWSDFDPKTPDPSLFELPADYHKIEMPLQMQGMVPGATTPTQ